MGEPAFSPNRSTSAPRIAALRSASREQRDEELKVEITRVHTQNYGVYGARKVWLQLNRERIRVARATVERLMRELGLRGAVRGRVERTTIADPADAIHVHCAQ